MAESQESFTVPFTRLNGKNWQDWKARVRVWLQAKELWSCTEAPPLQAAADASAEDKAAAAASQKRDRKAQGLLVLAVGPEQMPYVSELKNTHEVWTVLQRLNSRNTAGAKIHATRCLFDLRLQPGACVKEHIAKMVSAFNQLRQLGIPFSMEQQSYILLSSLDKSYETLALTLEAMPSTELTLEYISSRLADEQDKRQRERGLSSKGSYAVPKSGDAEFENTVNAFAARHCFRCGSSSHLIRNCTREPGQDSTKAVTPSYQTRSSRGRRRRGGGRGYSHSTQHMASAMALMQGRGQGSKLRWLIDSGASHHLVAPSSVRLQNCRHLQTLKVVTMADSTKRSLETVGTEIGRAHV